MRPAKLKVTKTKDAEQVFGDDTESTYRVPALYKVTLPSGKTYQVTGHAYSRMQRSEWYWTSLYNADSKGGFHTKGECLKVLAQLEEYREEIRGRKRQSPAATQLRIAFQEN